MFKTYEEAWELIIPSKGDKTGKRFGVLQFQEVKESVHVVVKLDNIFLGNMKLFSNQPLFQRVGDEVPQKQQVNSIQ